MKLQSIKTLILARDMARAVDFYTQVFGMQATTQSPMWTELTHGTTIIALHGGGDGTRNPTDLSFQVDNIVAAVRIIQEHGGRIVTQPEKRPTEPIVLAIFQDPEGNELMLTQYVG